jgi:phosphate-selective porin OprO/OprP
MRITISKGLTLAVASMLVLIGRAEVRAETAGYYSYSAPPVGQVSEIQDLRNRLDAYERELTSLRDAVNQTPAWQTAHAGGMIEDQGGPKEVPIITKPTHKIGGRIYWDNLWASQSATNMTAANGPGNLRNRTRFDTARIYIEGQVFENVNYKFQMAFGESMFPVFKDVYIQVNELPLLGHFRVGHFKEPFGLEQSTSSRFITFMERTLADMYVPARNQGLMAFNSIYDSDNAHWYLGTFRSESSDREPDDQEDGADWVVTGRIAWCPIYDEPSGGRYVIHVGAAGSYRNYGDETVRYVQDVGLDLTSATTTVGLFVDTDPVMVDDVTLLGFEAAAIWGPVHIAGEFIQSRMRLTGGGDAILNGGYVEVGYFLTGENRGYNRSSQSFDRVKPFEPFFRVRTTDGICRGRGAWQIAYRWARTDATDGAVTGGSFENHSLGVNWYLNSHARIMANFIHATNYVTPTTAGPVGGVNGGSANAFGMRFQIDY